MKSFNDFVIEISLALYKLYPEKLNNLEKDSMLLNKIEELAYIIVKKYDNFSPFYNEKERIEQEEEFFRSYDYEGEE